MNMHSLAEETLAFLKGTKTSESMSPSLQDALYVPIHCPDGTPLDKVLTEELLGGRDIVVSGTAGGGKTALIHKVVERFRDRSNSVCVIDALQSISDVDFDSSLLVIQDLTATGSEFASLVWKHSPRPPLLVAGNEGALLDSAWGDQMKSVVDDLRSLQEGESPNESSRPVVVDMAAIDPIKQGLSQILGHPLIHEAVRHWEMIQNQLEDSPRLLALRQLEDKRICESISRIFRQALGPGEVTFREMWNLISEILLEGDNLSTPPTSTWFWRLFYGNDNLSVRLQSASKPNHLSLPQVSMALYNGDLASLNLSPKALEYWVPSGGTARDMPADESLDMTRWNRIQFVALSYWLEARPSSLFVGLRPEVGSNSIHSPADLVALMNGFFRRKKTAQGHGLELWIDLGVERKDERPPGIVSVGVISLSQLKVVPSSVLANVKGHQISGARQFLRAQNNNLSTTIEITSRLIHGLLRGRNLRTFHRSGEEVDLALKQFYFACARVCLIEETDVLEVLHTQENGSSKIIRWKIAEQLQHLGGINV